MAQSRTGGTFDSKSRHHRQRKYRSPGTNPAVKYPPVEMVRANRDLAWIREFGTKNQKKALKEEGL